MNQGHNKKLTSRSQNLRRNMTKEERHLWYDFLKTLPVTVHRQKVFGQYIVDFYIAQGKIVIELDGSQHYDGAGKQRDMVRDDYLRSLGLTVLRYVNSDVTYRFTSVCQDIWQRLLLEEKLSAQLTDEV